MTCLIINEESARQTLAAGVGISKEVEYMLSILATDDMLEPECLACRMFGNRGLVQQDAPLGLEG